MSFKVKLRIAVAMSLKARLRIAIVALVTLVVVGMSMLYLYDFTRMSFSTASGRADLIADQVEMYLVDYLHPADRRPRPSSQFRRGMEERLDRNRS